ncbi:MAG: hypothetical protein KDA89_11730, partial [Planctomycetaceae bacterium]|nr:hypothetical protein [Planctomycetaceae bacterium]
FSGGGAFGTNLYVLEYGTDTILSIDSTGVVSTFASHVDFRDLDDLAFGPGTNGFSTNLYVSDGGFPGGVPGRIFEVTSSGAVSEFAANNGMTSAGITFASGSGFGTASLIQADSLNHAGNDGSVRSYASDGSSSVIINAGPSALFNPGDVVQGPGGAFGSDLFVSDWTTDAIYQLTAGGTLTEFSAGRTYANWIDADLLFSPDGTALYTSEGANGTITRIRLSSTTATTSVTVNNVAPTVTLDPDAGIDENGTAVLTGTITDVGTLDTFTVVIDWNAGGNVGGPGEGTTTLSHADLTLVSPGVYSFSTSHWYLDDNPTASVQDTYTISATVTDDDTLSGSDTTTVLVRNAAPLLTSLVSGNATLETKSDDGNVTISGAFSDIGTLDTHAVTVDWGDGSVVETLNSVDQWNDLFDGSHLYAHGGIYTMTVTVTDDDGGSVSATTTAVVTGVGLVDGTLYVIGTNGRDIVNIKHVGGGSGPGSDGGSDTRIRVIANLNVQGSGGGSDGGGDGGSDNGANISYFDPATVNRIEIHLCDGDDHVVIGDGGDNNGGSDGRLAVSALVFGGAGNDHLTGGAGDDVLIGGSGNDKLDGRGGNNVLSGGAGDDKLDGGDGFDILIGGTGKDQLAGRNGNDLLIGGAAGDEDDEFALAAALYAWANDDLSAALLNLGSITDDEDRDVLEGGKRL